MIYSNVIIKLLNKTADLTKVSNLLCFTPLPHKILSVKRQLLLSTHVLPQGVEVTIELVVRDLFTESLEKIPQTYKDLVYFVV